MGLLRPSGSWQRSSGMRKKTETLIIFFGTTTEAMKMEHYCEKNGLPGRLIPIPREITAGCGMAWKAKPEEKEKLQQEMLAHAIRWESMYILDL